MKVKISQLVESIGTLRKIASQDVAPRLAFKLARFIKKVNEEMSTYEKSATELFNKYAVEGEDESAPGQKVKIIPGNSPDMPVYKEARETLDNTEIDIGEFGFIEEEFDGVKLTPIDAMTIDFIFENR